MKYLCNIYCLLCVIFNRNKTELSISNVWLSLIIILVHRNYLSITYLILFLFYNEVTLEEYWTFNVFLCILVILVFWPWLCNLIMHIPENLFAKISWVLCMFIFCVNFISLHIVIINGRNNEIRSFHFNQVQEELLKWYVYKLSLNYWTYRT